VTEWDDEMRRVGFAGYPNCGDAPCDHLGACSEYGDCIHPATTVVALLRPGVLLSTGGRLADKLAEDAPIRERYRRQRAGQ
jgi:hypothetical protein